MVHEHLANMLNHLVNSKRNGKNSCIFSPYNKLMIKVLKIMMENGYINNFETKKTSKGGVLNIEIKKLNYCKAIKPRFNVKFDGYDKFIRRFLPSRHLGIIIVSTSKGLLINRDAAEKNLGGRLIAYCY